MAKVKVWKRTDGGVSVTHFDFKKKKMLETRDEYIERVSEKLRLEPLLVGAIELVVDSSTLPKRNGDRDKWVVSAGAVIMDSGKETKRERRQAKRQAVKDKLKSGLPLTEEEADFLTR